MFCFEYDRETSGEGEENMLTRKQHELLVFINARLAETGVSPSFEEMKDALDLKSKSGIHRLITALEERGFLRRLPNRARALEVIRTPQVPAGEVRRFQPSVVEGGRTGRPAARPAAPARDAASENGQAITIPVMGRIAAGTPIAAIQTQSRSITLSPEMLAGGEHYALEVRRQDTAATGDIVVALIDDEEATLKRLRRRGSSIALEAANPAYETRVLGPDRVRIQGRLVSLVRRY